MKTVTIFSLRAGAGKTSLALGLIQAAGVRAGYLKPFGDRLLYRKKRLWDHDSALVQGFFGLAGDPERMSIGFDHSKLRYMYDEQGVRARLLEAVGEAGREAELLLVEGPRDISYGASVHLDPLSIARTLGGRSVCVLDGHEDRMLDDLAFFRRHVDPGTGFAGIVVTKCRDCDEFRALHLPAIEALGVPVIGVVPFEPELTFPSVRFVAERLFAKFVAGESGQDRLVRSVFIGAMSAAAAGQSPGFQQGSDRLVITSGDRSDMVLAALDGRTAAVVLTNDILPPPNVAARAAEAGVPLLSVAADTFQAAKKVDDLEPLLTVADKDRIAGLGRMIAASVDLPALLG